MWHKLLSRWSTIVFGDHEMYHPGNVWVLRQCSHLDIVGPVNIIGSIGILDGLKGIVDEVQLLTIMVTGFQSFEGCISVFVGLKVLLPDLVASVTS